MEYDFTDKIVLVTGSTSGIGRQIAKQLLEAGATVVVHYGHNQAVADEAMTELKGVIRRATMNEAPMDEATKDAQATTSKQNVSVTDAEDRIMLVKANLADEKEVDEMFAAIGEKYGRLDGLVNCAAFDKLVKIEDLTVDALRYELDVNLVARFQCIKNCIPLMKESKMKRIVNIASRLGTRPLEESIPYCTSEAATIMLTKCAALELAPYGIRVNTVSPSLTLTPMAYKIFTDDEIKATAEKNPSKRLGKPEDAANAVLFLLSEEADYINGENLNVNGGILLK